MTDVRIPCALILALALGACGGTGDETAAAERPRLALLIVIDQLRPDALDASLPGGLGRLVREGRSFPAGAHAHGLTETYPGHVALATGRDPGPAGAPGNEYIDPETGRAVYCVADPRPESAVFDGPDTGGVSPAALHVPALGDWLKAARPGARVFSVAGKDRSAIALGGQHPDAAYWFESDGTPRFTSSRYYMESLPEWVSSFSAEIPRRIPPTWIHQAELGIASPDDSPGESLRYGRISGHPVGSGDAGAVGRQIYSSPFVDQLTLDFTRQLIEREDLGRQGPDLLLISLSGHDVVGHMYGPESHEARDARLRIDAWLGELLTLVESRGPVLVALSSDHGVLSLPEWLEEKGQSRCPVPGGRAAFGPLVRALQGALVSEVGEQAMRAPGRSWLNFAGAQLGIDRQRARDAGVAPERIVAALRKALDQQPAIARTWTAAEIRSGSDELAARYRRSLDPSRPPDLLIQVAEGCLISTEPTGTTHGSPYLYDRAVPIVFWGSGIEAGSDPRTAATVDVAPTLATRLGATIPEQIDGRNLLPPVRGGSR